MRIITDFHTHSKWSRACSKQLTLPNIAKTCEQKGIQFVGTSDFTHPAWREEIGRELLEEEPGVFCLKDQSSCTKFLLATELSCIYKRAGKTRRIHHLVLLSSLQAVDDLSARLNARGCNLKADGRPILGLDSEELLKIVLDVDAESIFIPAHAWTPWFGVFGSQSGFETLQECFGDFTKYIPAIETGLSSDPAMNQRMSQLDDILLVSNSDAHSLDNLGREANVFEMDRPNYQELRRILMDKDRTKFLETIEFFPEKGKYHADGHRDCHFWSEPSDTDKLNGICPICHKPLTIGVQHRLEALADRPKPQPIKNAVPFRSIVPLAELIGEVLQVGPKSKKVQSLVQKMVSDGRSEFQILLDLPFDELSVLADPVIATAICETRAGRITIRPGYDGEYGEIRFTEADGVFKQPKQSSLFV